MTMPRQKKVYKVFSHQTGYPKVIGNSKAFGELSKLMRPENGERNRKLDLIHQHHRY